MLEGRGEVRVRIKKLAVGYENLLADWVEWVSRHAIATLLFASILTLVALIHLTLAFEINTSTTDMLDKDVPSRQYASKLNAAFPQTKDTLVVVIEGDEPLYMIQLAAFRDAKKASKMARILSEKHKSRTITHVT